MPENTSQDRILDAANAVFLEEGMMPLSLSDVAERAGVSRSLIYSHFPTQIELMNGVLKNHIPILDAVSDAAECSNDHRTSLIQAALVYYDGLLSHGPTLSRAPNDSFLSGHVDNQFRFAAMTCLHRLARSAQNLFRLSPGEAVSSIIMLKALPDEAAANAWRGDVDREVCRSSLRDIISQAVDSMTVHENVYPETK